MGSIKTFSWRLQRLRRIVDLFPAARAGFGEDFVSAAALADHYRAVAARRSSLRRVLDAAIRLGFNLWIGGRTRRVARQFKLGGDWARRTEAIARARFCDPKEIALFRVERQEQLDVVFRRFEHAAFNKIVNPRGWTAACALRDKRVFHARCAAAGIPTPEVQALSRRGKVEVLSLPDMWPICVKPADGLGGVGVTMFDPAETPGDAASFAGALVAAFGRRTDWIAQQRLVAHPTLLPLAMRALVTARITTILDERGNPEIVTTVLRFPSREESLVDNIKAGGLMAPIDPATGRLGPGCAGHRPKEHATHPVTGAAIEGTVVPDWEAVKALALRVHAETYTDYTLVGWDVAPTPTGPVLLEGNCLPCLIVAQRAPRRGAGETRYGQLLAHHLAEARAGRTVRRPAPETRP